LEHRPQLRRSDQKHKKKSRGSLGKKKREKRKEGGGKKEVEMLILELSFDRCDFPRSITSPAPLTGRKKKVRGKKKGKGGPGWDAN